MLLGLDVFKLGNLAGLDLDPVHNIRGRFGLRERVIGLLRRW